MKILFLSAGAELGGGERSLLDLIASLRVADASLQISLIASADGPFISRCRDSGVETRVVPMPRVLESIGDSDINTGRIGRLLKMGPAALAAWRYARQLGHIIDELGPDVVHSNSIKFHLLTSLTSRRLWGKLPACQSGPQVGGMAQDGQAGSSSHRRGGRLLVWHVRDFLGSRPIVTKALKFGRPADGLIAISRAVADDAIATVPKARVEVVYNAIDVDHFCPADVNADRLDELAGLPPAPPGTVRVGLVATYAKWKGQDVFIDAAAKLVGKANARFYLVGGPIYQTAGSQWSRAELAARAASLGEAFGFIDFQSDPRDVYRALDIVVHASAKPEPFGRTIVEAMACGRAVIAAKAGGAAELFTDGVDAIGVIPNSATNLAEAIFSLVQSDERRRLLGTNARASAVKRFHRSRLGPEVLDAYERFRTGG